MLIYKRQPFERTCICFIKYDFCFHISKQLQKPKKSPPNSNFNSNFSKNFTFGGKTDNKNSKNQFFFSSQRLTINDRHRDPARFPRKFLHPIPPPLRPPLFPVPLPVHPRLLPFLLHGGLQTNLRFLSRRGWVPSRGSDMLPRRAIGVFAPLGITSILLESPGVVFEFLGEFCGFNTSGD